MLQPYRALTLVALILVVSSTRAPAAGLPARHQITRVQNYCERLLFAVKVRVQTPALTAEPMKIADFVDTFLIEARGFLSASRFYSELYRRSDLISKLSPKWLPVFAQRLRQMGLLESEEPNGPLGYLALVRRQKLFELNPNLKRFVPDNYRIAFAPMVFFEYFGIKAFVDPEERVVGIPPHLIYKRADFDDEQALAHELMHIRLQGWREANHSSRFGYHFETEGDVYDRLCGILPDLYAQSFYSEEILAHLINLLNFYESECKSGRSSFTDEKFGSKNIAKGHLDSYLEIVLPEVLGRIQQADFANSKGEVALRTINGSVELTMPVATPWEEWSEASRESSIQQIRENLEAERTIFESLRPLLNQFLKLTANGSKSSSCDQADPLWDFLKTIDLDPEEFRIRLPRQP